MLEPAGCSNAGRMEGRIVFINRYFYPDHSATSQLLSDLAFHLAEEGFRVTVVTGRQLYDAPDAGLAARGRIRGVEVHRVATTRFGRSRLVGRAMDYLSFYFSAAWRLARLLRHGDIVVAKTDPPLIGVVAAQIARRRGCVLVNWIQDLFPEVAEALGVRLIRGPVAKLLAGLRDTSLRTAQVNVVLGKLMADRVRSAGVPEDRIRIVPNWADGSMVRPVPPAANRLREEWGLGGKFVVGYSGNMGRAHESDTVLEVAERLRDERDVVFLWIGDGAQRSRLETEARRRGLRNCLFKPYQPRERLAESLSVPDVHLVTLRECLEGLIVPSKFYGIAAAGRPVAFIGSLDGEIARLVEAHKCGVAVEVGDADALLKKIVDLRDNRVIREEMGRNARALFAEAYDSKRVFSSWRDILEEMETSPDY